MASPRPPPRVARAPAPIGAPRPRRAPRAPRGILDHHRREKGIAVETPAADAASTTPTDGGCGATWDPEGACPVGCVAEVESPGDLAAARASAGDDGLVIVDYYRTACGACR
jgi:hypothetical protein